MDTNIEIKCGDHTFSINPQASEWIGLNTPYGYSPLYKIAEWIDTEEVINKARWEQFATQGMLELDKRYLIPGNWMNAILDVIEEDVKPNFTIG